MDGEEFIANREAKYPPQKGERGRSSERIVAMFHLTASKVSHLMCVPFGSGVAAA